MQVRTALGALSALLLLLAVVPHAPPEGHAPVAGDGEVEASAALAVDLEGPGDETGTLPDDPVAAPGAGQEVVADEGPSDEDGAPADDAVPDDEDAGTGAGSAADGDDAHIRAAGEDDIRGGGDDDHIPAEGEPRVVYRYEVETRGEVTTDQEAFSETTARILTDARGWTLGGSLAFEQDGDEPDFTVVLAAPDEVAAAHEECGPDYSCRVEDELLINDRNWRDATSAWREADGDFTAYRRYLINHEVGHFLGFGHGDCGEAGEQAPVMQQQSVSMQECEPNGWPLAWEREQLADQLDVSVRD